MLRQFKLFGSAVGVAGLVSCGTANVNKLFGSADNSYSSLMQRALESYDKGDFSTAEDLANNAYSRSTNNGDAGTLLGNIYLAQAGIDVFQLVSKLSTLSSTSTSSTSTTTDSCTTSTSNQSAGNVLSTLSCKLLNLSTADKNVLGTNQSFPNLSPIGITSVYIPNKVDDTLRAKVSVLAALDKGIRKLCPFINRSQVISQSIDARESDSTICPDQTTSTYSTAKAHITYAMLHMIEALVYQQGILSDGVSSTSAGVTGIATVSSKLSATSFSSVSTFASALSAFSTVVTTVFDTTSSNSQLALTLNGFTEVANCFTVAGVPASVAAVITKQLTNLKNMANTLKSSASSSASSSTNYQAQALQGQINQTYAKAAAAKINSLCPTSSSCSSSDISTVCSAYSSVSTGVDTSVVSKPTVCQ